MSNDPEYIFFNFSSDVILKDRWNLLSLVNRIIEDGEFKLARTYQDVLQKRSVDNIDDAVTEAWDKSINEKRAGVSIDFWNLNSFDLSVAVNFNFRQLVIVVNNGYISDLRPSDYTNVRSLVRMCELVYTALYPEYGYGLITPDVHPIADPEEGDITIKAIYDYNFFSPKLLQRLGREKVLSIPTWRTVQFDDGGVLLEMSPNPIADWKPYTSNYQKAAEILGVEKFYQGG